MARAETIESVAETGGGGNGPLSHPNTCRMELPRPLHAWPGVLATTAISTDPAMPGGGGARARRDRLHPLRALCMSYPLPHLQGEGQSRTHQGFPASWPPPSPLCRRAAPEDTCQSGGVARRHPPPGPPSGVRRHGGGAEAAPDVMRVAQQLRTIGDAFNAAARRRARVAPQWPGWRDACRGLLNFVTQTLSTLYRLT